MADMDVFESLTYKVKSTDSASPTIMIIQKNTTPPRIFKIWLKNDHSDETEGLRYEKDIYMKRIKPLVDNGDGEHLMHILGDGCSTIENLTTLFKLNDEDAFLLYACFLIYLKGPSESHTYDFTNVTHVLKYLIKNKTRRDKIIHSIKNEKIECIILPYIKCLTLHETLKTSNTLDTIMFVSKIADGIHKLYSNNLIHNDLHAGNILIKDDDILIYDWDRGYSQELGPNKLLDNNRCGPGLCSYSQCNIRNPDGYAIDLYKILYYILDKRHTDASTILKSVFKIQNIESDPDRLSKIIKILTISPFFREYHGDEANRKTEKGAKFYCTFLQYPDENMKYIKSVFGPIQQLHNKLPTIKLKNLSKFSFKDGNTKFDHIYNNNNLQEIHQKIPTQLKNKSNTINKIKMSTTKDNIIPSKNITVKAGKTPPKQPITTYMEQNDLKKYGPGKKTNIKDILKYLQQKYN